MVNERAAWAASRRRDRRNAPTLTPVSDSPVGPARVGASLIEAAGVKTATVSSGQGIRITIEPTITSDQVELFYDLYLAAFGPLRTKAVGRQVLSRREFVDEMADPRVWKYVAWDDHGQPQALSTLTRTLETVPWISPEYFAARYPEQTARDAVYYLGFVLTRPQLGGHLVLLKMLTAVIDRLAADRAVCGFDICLFNNATMHFGRQLETLTRRLAGASTESIDTQTYYSTTFP